MNFLKASKDLKKLLKDVDWERIRKESREEIEFDWQRNVPQRPHSNSSVEVSIKIFKAALRRALGAARVTEDELTTIFAECSALVNSRPLGTLPSSHETLPISPSMLVKGSDDATAILPTPDPETDKSLAERFNAREKMLNAFWAIWHKMWLQNLAVTNYWHRNSHIVLKEGQVLQIQDPSQKRFDYRFGVIVKLHKSKDGKVRSCDLRLSNGSILTRGLNRLAVFEFDTIQMTKTKRP